VFNGQTANKAEQNKNLHVVARVAYPFQIGEQIIEPAIQGYTGKYILTSDQLSPGVAIAKGNEYVDRRVAATFILYPKPFGVMSEFNIGKGPQFNKLTDSIETSNLEGGYVTLNYMIKYKKQIIFPFFRGHYYLGGKKFEQDARNYDVKEFEWGIEWQPFKNFELVAEYVKSRRRFEDFRTQDNLQKGELLRLQAQLNF
jgi:hypothetical protein